VTLHTLWAAVFVGVASLVMLGDSWRVSLPALGVLNLLLGLLLGASTIPVLGLIQVLVGAVSVLMLYATIRSGPSATFRGVEYVFGLPYRIATGVFALAIAFSLAETYPFPDVPVELNFAVYWLGSLGLMMLVLARRVMAIGFAVLMLEAVGILLLTIFSQGPGLTRLLLASVVEIAITLAISYLMVLERQGELVG
jgi:hypothetical protein